MYRILSKQNKYEQYPFPIKHIPDINDVRRWEYLQNVDNYWILDTFCTEKLVSDMTWNHVGCSWEKLNIELKKSFILFLCATEVFAATRAHEVFFKKEEVQVNDITAMVDNLTPWLFCEPILQLVRAGPLNLELRTFSVFLTLWKSVNNQSVRIQPIQPIQPISCHTLANNRERETIDAQ